MVSCRGGSRRSIRDGLEDAVGGCEEAIERLDFGEGIEGDTVEELLQAVPTAYQWGGLDRYWRKKSEREAAQA